MRIGTFEILPINEEYFEVRLHLKDDEYLPALVYVRDMETILQTIFITRENSLLKNAEEKRD